MSGSPVLAPPEVENFTAEDLVLGAEFADFAFQGAEPFGGDGELGAEGVGAGRAAG